MDEIIQRKDRKLCFMGLEAYAAAFSNDLMKMLALNPMSNLIITFRYITVQLFLSLIRPKTSGNGTVEILFDHCA